LTPKKIDDGECPVNGETREWLEGCFVWFIKTFRLEKIKKIKVLTPSPADFPIKYNGQNESAIDTMKIVANQMEINPDDIMLDIYTEGQTELDSGGVFENRIFLQSVEGEKYSGGLYFGKQEDNKYHIALEKEKLNDPIAIVATLAHELAHVKLLGEKRIEKNNEDLTNLLTIIFGLGIFNANVSFQTKSGFGSWGWSKSGYLSQMEWGYSLALFAYIRGEKKPDWVTFLSTNIKSDFEKSIDFIHNNPVKSINDIIGKKGTEPLKSKSNEISFKTFTYKCKEGVLSIEQEHQYPNVNEKVSLNNLPAPTGTYRTGWFSKINVIEGRVA
jgi:hypothetical protein